jgi:diadenosine tetraphosphate (Ap4A) HIT family hydrolase
MPYAFRGQDPCPVCLRLTGEGSWPVVAASEFSVAFVPSRQPATGTTLLVPRRHACRPRELPDAEAEDGWMLLRRLIAATMLIFEPPSYHVSQYVGEITGEPFDHLSWRLEPRYGLPPARHVPVQSLPRVPVAERERQAALLRRHLRPAASQ